MASPRSQARAHLGPGGYYRHFGNGGPQTCLPAACCVAQPMAQYGSSSSNKRPRPSRGAKPRGADDTRPPQGRPHQVGSHGGIEIKARGTSRGAHDASHETKTRWALGGRQPAQCPRFLFGAKGASVGAEYRGIKQRVPFRCSETKTSSAAGGRSPWSPRRRHHQCLWQSKTNFSQDKCTRCSPSKWPIVGALPAQYLGRGLGPLPINRTSHPQGRGEIEIII